MWTSSFMKPEDFGDAMNSGGQKYHKQKAEVEQMLNCFEEKNKLRKDIEEVKVAAEGYNEVAKENCTPEDHHEEGRGGTKDEDCVCEEKEEHLDFLRN